MGGKSRSSGTTTVQPWSGQRPYLKAGFENASDIYSQGPITYPERQLVAHRRPSYDKGQEKLAQFAREFGAPGGIYNATEDAMRSAMLAPDVANNPYVQGIMGANADIVMENLERTAIPGIEDAATMAGQFGGSRHGVSDALATGEAMNAIARSNADIMNTAYGQGLSAQANAMGMLPTMGQMGMLPGIIDRNIGLQNQAHDQAILDARTQRDLFDANAPWQSLQNYMSAIGGSHGSQTSGTLPSSGASGFLSGALGGAQLGGLLPASFGPWGPIGGAAVGGLLSMF